MWGYSNMQTLTVCEMVSAFSTFLLSLINTETQALLKQGFEETELDFPVLQKLNMSYNWDHLSQVAKAFRWSPHMEQAQTEQATQLNKYIYCSHWLNSDGF